MCDSCFLFHTRSNVSTRLHHIQHSTVSKGSHLRTRRPCRRFHRPTWACEWWSPWLPAPRRRRYLQQGRTEAAVFTHFLLYDWITMIHFEHFLSTWLPWLCERLLRDSYLQYFAPSNAATAFSRQFLVGFPLRLYSNPYKTDRQSETKIFNSFCNKQILRKAVKGVKLVLVKSCSVMWIFSVASMYPTNCSNLIAPCGINKLLLDWTEFETWLEDFSVTWIKH